MNKCLKAKRMKSAVWIFVIACLCLCLTMPLSAIEAEEPVTFKVMTTDDNPVEIHYQVMTEGENGKNGTVQVYRFESAGQRSAISTDTQGKIIIPETVSHDNKAYDVTCIGGDAFNSCELLTEIVLPSSVTTINNYAFYGCLSLKNINLSDVKTIAHYAFAGCTSLETITLPSDLPYIDQSLFRGCTNFKKIILPNGITQIRNNSFAGTALTEIFVPANVRYIKPDAFFDCDNFINIVVDKDNPYFTSVDGILYNKQITALEIFPMGRSGEYNEIPDTVTSISSSAFSGCRKLTGVTLPDGLSHIGAGVFDDCDSLKSIYIPSSVTVIETRPFGHSDSIMEINVDKDNPNFSSLDGVLYDKDKTVLLDFPNGKEFIANKIPDTVIEIAERAFAGYNKTSAFAVPNNVKTIGADAFHLCNSLVNIALPASVTNMSVEAFWTTNNLKLITFKGSTPPVFSGYYSGVWRSGDLTVYIPKGSMEAYKKTISGEEHDGSRDNIQYIEVDFPEEDDKDPYAFFFIDVPRGKWYTENVNLAASMNIVKGVGGGCYEPDSELTRAELVSLMHNLLSPLEEADNQFVPLESDFYTDVIYPKWYYYSIRDTWMAGFLKDFKDPQFYPEKAITREEMASILAAALEYKKLAVQAEDINLSGEFTDFKDISPAYAKAVQAVYKLNLMRGAGDRTFSPKGLTTRAEAATVLVNLTKILREI